MLKSAPDYSSLYDGFAWNIPEFFNIAVDVCDKWAMRDPTRTALIIADTKNITNPEKARKISFQELRGLSNQLANSLGTLGVERGDRVAVLLPQSLEAAYSHLAILKIGAISVPLFTLFGVDALLYRLSNAGVKVVLTNQEGVQKLAPLLSSLPDLECILTCEDSDFSHHQKIIPLENALFGQSEDFRPVNTRSEDPAFIIYTSGTTGQPKGAVHAHRVLLGHLPGVEMSHDFFPQEGDRIWTPADWAWIGGLLDVLMPALYHGVPVLTCRFTRFSAMAAFDVLQNYNIRNTFLPPTALKMMRAVENADTSWKLHLRSVASGGESLGRELLEWGRKVFGVTINEFYGQTECNMIISSCGALMETRTGYMGKAVPGHLVDIVDNSGNILPHDVPGHIAVKHPDTVMFLGYWNNYVAAKDKFIGPWMLTGDIGCRDKNGWFQFVGRDDDVITSSGYRIGPGEIEDCLLTHPLVKMAAVIGKPDEYRTQIVKAFVVLKDGRDKSDATIAALQDYVKRRLSAHEYPREIEFVDTLPLTPTGKIIRRILREGG